MTQIQFNLRVKLFDTKGIKVLLLFNNIENDKKKTSICELVFFFLRIKMLYYYIFLIEKCKTNLKSNFKN
jgi:hypothetical protein